VKTLPHQVHVVPLTSQTLVTTVPCDSDNNNFYHQRLTEESRPDYIHIVQLDLIKSPSLPSLGNISSYETSHSSIAYSLRTVVSVL
jgi:hypothetical protein